MNRPTFEEAASWGGGRHTAGTQELYAGPRGGRLAAPGRGATLPPVRYATRGSAVAPGERQRERERLYAPRAPHLRELPQGCLISLIVVATVWFGAWAVVLVLALNFLRAPFKG
jgi:hypothetical protein